MGAMRKLLRWMAGFGLVFGIWRMAAVPMPRSRSSGRGRLSHVPSAEAMREGFEVRDLSARGLAYVLLGLGSSAATLIGIVFGLVALFTHWDRMGDAHFTLAQRAVLTAPAPRLQTYPMVDLRRERERELRGIDGYAWLDAAHTRAHVPISRAMALVDGHSLDESP